MTKLKKEFKKEFKKVKKLFFIVLIISIIQSILSIFGYFPILQRIGLSPNMLLLEDTELTIFSFLSIIKTILFLSAGIFIFLKDKFEIKRLFYITLILFSASLPALILTERNFSGLPLTFKLISLVYLIIINFLIYFLICAFGGLLSEAYKR